MKHPGTFAKAIYAALGAFLTGLGSVLVGAHTLSSITASQWVSLAVLSLGAGGAVYGVTNTPPTGGSSGGV